MTSPAVSLPEAMIDVWTTLRKDLDTRGVTVMTPGSGPSDDDPARSLLESLPDVVFRLDLELRYLYISSAVEAVMRQPADSCLGKTRREMGLPGKPCDDFEAACRQVQSVEFVDYGRRFISRVLPEFGSDGAVVSLLGTTEDISERKHSEKELRESEREKRALLRSRVWSGGSIVRRPRE